MVMTLTLASLVRVLVASRAELGAFESTINSLNVYPVPDGDTGTNMRATLDAGLCALDGRVGPARGERAEVRAVLEALTRGAQGNSGVILSEYVRGFVRGMSALPGVQDTSGGLQLGVDGDGLARALHEAASSARGAVDRPVEGTMLSVAEAAAVAAGDARSEALHAGGVPDVEDVAEAAFVAAKAALARSPQQLDVLAQAGVVDAGGVGLTIVLECLSRVAQGRHGLPRASERSWLPRANGSAMRAQGACRVSSGGPAFEVMGVAEGLDDDAAGLLRRALSEIGDSAVVAGGDGLHRLHVHTDIPLAAISRARETAALRDVTVTRFAGGLETLARTLVVTRDAAVRQYAQSLGATCAARLPSTKVQQVVLADAGAPGDGAETHTLVRMLLRLDEIATGLDGDEHVEVLQADTWRAARDLIRPHLEAADVVMACVSPEADLSAVAQFRAYLAQEAEGVGAEVEMLRLESGFLVQLGVIHG